MLIYLKMKRNVILNEVRLFLNFWGAQKVKNYKLKLDEYARSTTSIKSANIESEYLSKENKK